MLLDDEVARIAEATAKIVLERLDLGTDFQARCAAFMLLVQQYYERHWQAQPSGSDCHCPTCVRFRELRDKTPGDPTPDHVPGACRGGNEGGDSSA